VHTQQNTKGCGRRRPRPSSPSGPGLGAKEEGLGEGELNPKPTGKNRNVCTNLPKQHNGCADRRFSPRSPDHADRGYGQQRRRARRSKGKPRALPLPATRKDSNICTNLPTLLNRPEGGIDNGDLKARSPTASEKGPYLRSVAGLRAER